MKIHLFLHAIIFKERVKILVNTPNLKKLTYF